MPGMMIHQDGSAHECLPGNGRGCSIIRIGSSVLADKNSQAQRPGFSPLQDVPTIFNCQGQGTGTMSMKGLSIIDGEDS
jgi:hypothetical protein